MVSSSEEFGVCSIWKYLNGIGTSGVSSSALPKPFVWEGNPAI